MKQNLKRLLKRLLKRHLKRFLMWVYNHRLITMETCQRVYDRFNLAEH
jgi:hypothetical protein